MAAVSRSSRVARSTSRARKSRTARSHNHALNDGGGVYKAQGGALNFDGFSFVVPLSTSEVSDSLIARNKAEHNGGGLWAGQGGACNFQNLGINGNSVLLNEAVGSGGGIYIEQGSLHLGCTLIV